MKTIISRRSPLTAALFCVVVFVIYWYSSYIVWLVQKFGRGGLKHAPPKKQSNKYSVRPKFHVDQLQRIPKDWVRANKCPACYGMNLCQEIETENIMVEIPVNQTAQSHKGVYFGMWDDRRIAIKMLAKEDNEFKLFDQFICKQAKLDFRCDVSKAILNTPLNRDDINVETAKEAFTVSHKNSKDFTAAQCMTERLVDAFTDAFLEKVPFEAQALKSHLAMLYTSLVLNPEGLMLRFLQSGRSQHDMAFPAFYGACGRLIVVEDAGQPLDEFVKESWQTRAALALSLLMMIENFQVADDYWMVFFGDYKYSNFAVNDEGQLKLVDVEDIMIIDKDKAASVHFEHPETEICNKDCFLNISNSLRLKASVDKDYKKCVTMMHYPEVMNALLCNNILSDLEEHKYNPMFGKETRDHPGGLLRNPPKSMRTQIENLLKECVVETKSAGRVGAVKDLKQILADYSVSAVDEEDDG